MVPLSAGNSSTEHRGLDQQQARTRRPNNAMLHAQDSHGHIGENTRPHKDASLPPPVSTKDSWATRLTTCSNAFTEACIPRPLPAETASQTAAGAIPEDGFFLDQKRDQFHHRC
ncbi:hypothetical protein CCHR01_14916 [Colletotrichum chrysophilum]|uniref:Uncharacterized protein n=1 Tax=Colletotrichum chrysophilum TaxID=1836956 RepID=A0AAD9A7P8_9PEZI|nr:hypothetical protein CCHR01_14916 [Colletotrichum chrysophilum]